MWMDMFLAVVAVLPLLARGRHGWQGRTELLPALRKWPINS